MDKGKRDVSNKEPSIEAILTLHLESEICTLLRSTALPGDHSGSSTRLLQRSEQIQINGERERTKAPPSCGSVIRKFCGFPNDSNCMTAANRQRSLQLGTSSYLTYSDRCGGPFRVERSRPLGIGGGRS
jgi:hypothetical protein